MKTIYADYNAATEAGQICLTTRGSQVDIERTGARPGDWVWLSDREVVVGRDWPPMIATDWSVFPIGTLSSIWMTMTSATRKPSGRNSSICDRGRDSPTTRSCVSCSY